MKAYMVHRGDSITGIRKRYGNDLLRLLGAVSNVEIPEATAACVKDLAPYHGPEQGLVVRSPPGSAEHLRIEEIPGHVDALITAVAAYLD